MQLIFIEKDVRLLLLLMSDAKVFERMSNNQIFKRAMVQLQIVYCHIFPERKAKSNTSLKVLYFSIILNDRSRI